MHEGTEIELVAGPPVHGGHCLSRFEGRVVFLRHAVPGERVLAQLTGTRQQRHWRADAIQILQPSPDRVPTPWPEAGPGGVGGGELGHIRLSAQRYWKRTVLDDALQRIGKIPDDHPARASLEVLCAPGDEEQAGLGYRSRVQFIADDAGRAGMFQYRSHQVRALAQMPLASPEIDVPTLLRRRWQPGTRIDAIAPSSGRPLILVDGKPLWGERKNVRERLELPGRGQWHYRVEGAAFWQIHRKAPEVLVEAVLAAAEVQPGDTVLDLYSGSGLFSLPLADAVGSEGAVHAIESDPGSAKQARRNAHDRPQIDLQGTEVLPGLARVGRPDVVILDPPRTGAGPAVMSRLTTSAPRRIVYVACDPAALARDVRSAREAGYELTAATGYDLFCHTHHLETIAVLEPRASVASDVRVR